MLNKKLLIVPLLVVFFVVVIHVPIFIKGHPVVTQYFTIQNDDWMDGPYIYGQYTIDAYTNKTWWGYYGGTNRSWGIYTHKNWPLITVSWGKSTVDKAGVWHETK